MDGITRYEEIEQHLLFHKALSEDSESFERISGYMNILSHAEGGERLEDPVDESIRSIFSLAVEGRIDPWAIDISEFTRIYTNKVSEDRFDMIVSGKLLLMAWKVLRLQSEVTRERSEPQEPELEMPDDFFFEENEGLFVPQVAFKEAYVREPIRKVTMYELIDAFEDARNEMAIQTERERVRKAIKDKEPRKFDNKAHDEDDKEDVQAVWNKIKRLGTGEICIDELYTPDMIHNLTVFIAVLHLTRDGKLDLRQEQLPRGEIIIEMLIDPPSAEQEMASAEAI
ncbi:MAG TPA: chromosome segregation protein ScpA [Candidatus Methanomethylophilaceae archaeon]|nr:chromosome segregation protein ScpA [Candidatus Methanomethylophilaceae archaeon]